MNIIIPYNHDSFSLNCDFIFQTIKQLLKKNYHVYLILRLYPTTFLSGNSYCSPKLLNDIQKQFQNHEKLINLTVIQTPLLFPYSLEKFSQKISYFNYLYFIHWFKKYINRFSSAIIWSFDPQNEDIFKIDYHKNIIKLFDCVDFFTSIDTSTATIIRQQIEDHIRYSNIVMANSQVLLDQCRLINPHSYIVVQGFDFASFQYKSNISQHKYPRIGFIGNLTYRLDFQLLEELIRNTPQYHFFLSDAYLACQPEDSLVRTNQKISRLKKMANITWLPQMSRAEVKAWMEKFDICIIPYNCSFDFNKYSYPMKLFEYFYIGKPVISTPIEELKRFPKYVKIGSTAEEWERHIKELLAKPWPKKYKQEQRRLAIANSWENKVNQILQHIEAYEKK